MKKKPSTAKSGKKLTVKDLKKLKEKKGGIMDTRVDTENDVSHAKSYREG